MSFLSSSDGPQAMAKDDIPTIAIGNNFFDICILHSFRLRFCSQHGCSIRVCTPGILPIKTVSGIGRLAMRGHARPCAKPWQEGSNAIAIPMRFPSRTPGRRIPALYRVHGYGIRGNRPLLRIIVFKNGDSEGATRQNRSLVISEPNTISIVR